MPTSIRIPTPLRRFTNGTADVELHGDTVSQLLDSLGTGFPELRGRLLDASNGSLNRFVHIYVNDEDIRFLKELDTPVGPADRVSIILAVAGG